MTALRSTRAGRGAAVIGLAVFAALVVGLLVLATRRAPVEHVVESGAGERAKVSTQLAVTASDPVHAGAVDAGRRSVGRSVRVRAVDSEGGAVGPLSGWLHAHWASVEHPGTATRFEVIDGVATIGPATAQSGALLFTSFVDDAGRSYPVADGALMAADVVAHDVRVVVEDTWFLRAVDALTNREVTELELVCVDRWRADLPTPAEPPCNARALPRSEAQLELTGPAGRVYWLRGEGYAWSAFEWDRRRHIGHVVSLQPLGAIVAACSCGAHTLELTAVDRDRPTRETWTAASRLPGPALRAGDWSVRASWTDHDVECYVERVVHVPASPVSVVFDCARGARRLWVRARGFDDVRSTGLHRLDLWREGSSGAIEIDAAPHVDAVPLGWDLRWERLSPAVHLVKLPNGVLYPVDLTLSDGDLTVDLLDCHPRVVRFVDPRNGNQVTPKWVRWSAVAGGLPDFATTMLPESGAMLRGQGQLSLSMPAGHVHFVIDAGTGPRVGAGAVPSGAAEIEIEVPDGFRLELVNVPSGVPRWWLDEFELLSAEVALPTSLSHYPGRKDVWGSIFAQARPDRIRVPPASGFDAEERVVPVPDWAQAASFDFAGGVTFR